MDPSGHPGADPPGDDLHRGRAACQRREWRSAWEALTRADEQAPLGPEDLWLLALSGYLVGRGDVFVSALERAHRLHQEAGEHAAAARMAFWVGFHLATAGETARASGWLGRAARVLEGAGGEHVEGGYLLIPAAHQRAMAGDHEGAARIAAEAAEIGQRFRDRDLLALALHMQGRALLSGGEVEEGLSLLDETMIAVAADELSPPVTGLIYCSVIGACRSVYALGRAHEWTAALAEWCERQPDMVAYTGECRVYRSELLQLHGAWSEAIDEARRAGERLPAHAGAPLALALYQQGEVYRLRGDVTRAEEAYRAASRAGREPQPGLALLRLGAGDSAAAAAAIRRAIAETPEPLRRARILPAYIEIMVAAGDLEEARGACEELEGIASRYGSAALTAMVAHARGAVALAAGDARAALPHLRHACHEWQALDAPYDAARARLLLGLACRDLGDDEGAALELEAARAAFDRLGAATEVARLERLTGGGGTSHGGGAYGLTPRELEVLALVATGKTNRAVADDLFISDKTVARHLSNIFTKLGLSSRAAATAWAYEHDVAGPSA